MPWDAPLRGEAAEALNAARLERAIASFDRQHPYLLFDRKEIPAITARAEHSALGQALDRCSRAAVKAGIDPRMRMKRRARGLILMAFAAIVGPAALRARAEDMARRHLLEFIHQDSWLIRPSKTLLDRAEIAIAVALAYDWLFAILTPEERLAVEEALHYHILAPALDAYMDASVGWPHGYDNCTFASNAGVLIAALAVLGRNASVAGVLRLCLNSIWRAFAAFGPDGAWPEGPTYWSIVSRQAGLSVAALESTLGDDFRLTERPGFAQTGEFALHIRGAAGHPFNFGDSSCEIDCSALAWFAHRFSRPTDGWLAKETPGWFLPFNLIWGERPVLTPEATKTATTRFFSSTGLACFRNNWSDRREARSVFFAIRGAANSAHAPACNFPHLQLDAGSFVLDGGVTRWAVDLGPDEYDLPGYFDLGAGGQGGRRWRYYRVSADGHNTLVIAGRKQVPGARVPVVGKSEAAGASWVILDLSEAYGYPLSTLLRGAALLGRHVIVRDEFRGYRIPKIVWRLHTQAKPESVSASHVEFRAGEDRFEAQIIEPRSAAFRLSRAPAPRSFRIPENQLLHGHRYKSGDVVVERRYGDAPGRGAVPTIVRRLDVGWPKDARHLTVVLSPDTQTSLPAIGIRPLEQWPTAGVVAEHSKNVRSFIESPSAAEPMTTASQTGGRPLQAPELR